jgi:hypothetical protein
VRYSRCLIFTRLTPESTTSYGYTAATIAVTSQRIGTAAGVAGLGVNRRVDWIRWSLTPPPGHERIFDVYVLAVDHLTGLVDAINHRGGAFFLATVRGRRSFPAPGG